MNDSLFVIVFWTSVFLTGYAYVGYAVLLWIMVKIKELIKGEKKLHETVEFPDVTLLIAAYNEKDYVECKVKNSCELDYPKEKLQQVWVTDGSDDGTNELLNNYQNVIVYHKPEREGKIAAINRVMKLLATPIVIFSDANAILAKESVLRIVRLFNDAKVGCVSGEKRLFDYEKNTAAGSGEGLYWKYESFQKRYDARLYSVVGAAGELFAIRRELFTEVECDTLLDDFVISLRIAMQGYITQYDTEAYTYETPSANIKEELKRKIRIAAGGFQAIVRLTPLLNIFKYGILSFQYISHRVLRWTLAPLSLLTLFASNLILVLQFRSVFFTTVFCLQILFYTMALIGWSLENRKIKLKILFVPYYFFIMNLAIYLGFFSYLTKSQDVKWEKTKRR